MKQLASHMKQLSEPYETAAGQLDYAAGASLERSSLHCCVAIAQLVYAVRSSLGVARASLKEKAPRGAGGAVGARHRSRPPRHPAS